MPLDLQHLHEKVTRYRINDKKNKLCNPQKPNFTGQTKNPLLYNRTKFELLEKKTISVT